MSHDNEQAPLQFVLDDKALKLEIAPDAKSSKIYAGDTEISSYFHTIEVHANVEDECTSIILKGYMRPLTDERKPMVVEGVLISEQDAKWYFAWKRGEVNA